MFCSGQRQQRSSERGAALPNRFLKQTFRLGRCHQHAGVHRSGRLSEDRNVVHIPAELRDVVLDPMERQDLVLEAVISRRVMSGLGGELRMSEKAEDAETVIHRDEDDSVIDERAVFIECA